MGIVARLRRWLKRTASEWWPNDGGIIRGRTYTRAGVAVDEDLARTYSAIWCAERILSEAVSGLPLHLYRRLPDGSREIASDHPKNRLVNFPNPRMGGRSFREGRIIHQLAYGSGFAEIEYQGDRQVALWPIHTSRVRPVRPGDRDTSGNQLPEENYIVRNNDGTSMMLTPREMLHIPGAISEDGVWGKSIIQHARESIGFGLAHLRHGATNFGAGNIPRVVISIPGLKNPEDRRNYRNEWKEIHGSPDSGEVAILPVEGKITPLSMSNVDAEFVASGAFPVKDVSRFYRLPMHMLGEYEKAASYASVEMQGIEFVVYSLMPWIQRWEEQLNLKLLSDGEQGEYYFEHNVAGLLRGDFKSRMEGYEVGLRTGIFSINMVCSLENMRGIGPDGDERYVMTNMTTARRMAIGPQAELPPEEPEVDPLDAANGETAGEILALPDIRQTTEYTCGCIAAQIVAEFYGVGGMSEMEYAAALGATPEDGTAPEALIEWFTEQGLTVTAGQKWTVENLRSFFEQGQPVVCPVQMYGKTEAVDAEEKTQNRNGHYVVVCGVGLGMVIVMDPSYGLRAIPVEEFDAIWHDIEADGSESDHFGIAVGESVALQTQEEMDADNAEVSKEDDETGKGNNSNSDKQRNAATAVVRDTLTRMYAKESNAASRAAKGDFDAWTATWENKHRETLIDALRPACAVLQSCGIAVDAESLARRLAADSVSVLKLAYDTDTREQFAERMATWAKVNTDKVVSEVFGTGD